MTVKVVAQFTLRVQPHLAYPLREWTLLDSGDVLLYEVWPDVHRRANERSMRWGVNHGSLVMYFNGTDRAVPVSSSLQKAYESYIAKLVVEDSPEGAEM